MTTSHPLLCPYCNSYVPAPVGGPPQRLLCPRCGEAFPYRLSEDEGGAALGPPPAPLAGAPATPRWSKWSVAGVVLGVMGFMAAAALTFVLLTTNFRRANDFPTGLEEDPARLKVVAPRDLPGLGYLPADTNVVAAVHVAEALQDPAGREFLARFGAASVLPQEKQGRLDFGIDSLEKLTGVRLLDMDHLVLGLTVQDRLTPRMTLVVQTRRRYDAERIRAALKASRSPEPGERQLFRFQMEKSSLEPVLWFAAERTVIVGLSAEDLAAVPQTPQPPGAAHLSPALREVLRERMGPSAQAWVAGHADNWDKTSVKFLLAGMSKDDRQVLEKVRTFAGSLQFGPGMSLNADFDCADAAAAEALEGYLIPNDAAGRKPIPVLGGRAETAPIARELGQTLKAFRKDSWVTVQAKARPETVQQALQGDAP